MNDYKFAVDYSIFVFVPLGIFKILGMVKKLLIMSSSKKTVNEARLFALKLMQVRRELLNSLKYRLKLQKIDLINTNILAF